ncbi:unnamed protein product [Camellia sinensis]
MSGMGAGKGPQSEDQKPNMADQSQSNQLNIKVKNQATAFKPLCFVVCMKQWNFKQGIQPSFKLAMKKTIKEGNEVYFRIKRNTQLRKLMTAYCDRQSLDPKSIVFLFEGRRIHAEQTPDQLGMEDCDEVDAMLHQTGGGGGGFGDI